MTVLFIDAYNLYIRHYVSHPGMTLHGQQSGGVMGFLRTLQSVCDDIRPDRVYVVWEAGGSARRRGLYPDYKMMRRPQKLNRFYDSDEIPDTVENNQWQVLLLTHLLRNIPVIQIYVEDIEADDAIGYLAKYRHVDDRKIFLTSDRDYYQLLDRKSLIYRPGRKKFISFKDVKEEFGVSCTNFALAKAVCGDVSDNVPGVKGVGFKTLAKHVPQLAENIDVTIDELIATCREHSTKYAVLKRICESEELIRRNWRLVYLDMAMMSPGHLQKIDSAADYQAVTRKMDLMRLLMKSGITDIDVDRLIISLSTINHSTANKENNE